MYLGYVLSMIRIGLSHPHDYVALYMGYKKMVWSDPRRDLTGIFFMNFKSWHILRHGAYR